MDSSHLGVVITPFTPFKVIHHLRFRTNRKLILLVIN